jgi:hypothetical protein
MVARRGPSGLPRLSRVRNTMKHVCVASRIGDGKAPGEGNSRSIAKTSNAASRGGRSRFQALYAWMRPRSATGSAPNPRDSRPPSRSHPRRRGPCSTPRCAADSGCNPSGWHEFWPMALSKSPLLRMTKPRVFLLALSQNRDSASRVSWCYGLLLRRKNPAGARARRSFADEAHGC